VVALAVFSAGYLVVPAAASLAFLLRRAPRRRTSVPCGQAAREAA
jgi:hypothetical protein